MRHAWLRFIIASDLGVLQHSLCIMASNRQKVVWGTKLGIKMFKFRKTWKFWDLAPNNLQLKDMRSFWVIICVIWRLAIIKLTAIRSALGKLPMRIWNWIFAASNENCHFPLPIICILLKFSLQTLGNIGTQQYCCPSNRSFHSWNYDGLVSGILVDFRLPVWEFYSFSWTWLWQL